MCCWRKPCDSRDGTSQTSGHPAWSSIPAHAAALDETDYRLPVTCSLTGNDRVRVDPWVGNPRATTGAADNWSGGRPRGAAAAARRRCERRNLKTKVLDKAQFRFEIKTDRHVTTQPLSRDHSVEGRPR